MKINQKKLMKKKITMRQKILTILTILGLGIAAKADNVIITGEANTIPDGAIAYLFKKNGIMSSSIALDTITDGKFKLTLTTDSTLSRLDLNIYVENGINRNRKGIYVRPGAEIKIKGDDDFVGAWEVISNLPEQAESDRYLYANKDILNKLNTMEEEYDKRKKSASDKEEENRISEEYKATRPYRDSLDNVMRMKDIEIMKNTRVNEVWLDKMEETVMSLSLSRDDYADASMKELYSVLNDSIKNSRQGLKIGKLLFPDPLIEVGDKFPNVIFRDLTGGEHCIQEMSGKWTVVVLWSVGCPGSHYAFQELPKLLARNNDALNGVLLSIDTDEWWRISSKNYNIGGNNWSEGLEDMGLFRRFGAKGMPTVVMVTPGGMVADIFLGFYTERIEENLNKKVE